MPKKRRPAVISFSELEKKETKALLGYLKRLQQCEESFELSDLTINPDLSDHDTIFFKETEKWITAYKHVKSILENREHIKR